MLFYIIGFLVIAGFGLVILKIRNKILLNIEQAEKSGLVRNVNIDESDTNYSNYCTDDTDGIYGIHIDAQGRYNPIPDSPFYNPLRND